MTKTDNFDQQGLEQDAFSKYLCPSSSDEEDCEKQPVDSDHEATGKMGRLTAERIVIEVVAATRRITFKSKELYKVHGGRCFPASSVRHGLSAMDLKNRV